MTTAEAKAIDDLRALARRWPKSLMLVIHADNGGDISVKRASDEIDVANLPSLALIKIRTEVCA